MRALSPLWRRRGACRRLLREPACAVRLSCVAARRCWASLRGVVGVHEALEHGIVPGVMTVERTLQREGRTSRHSTAVLTQRRTRCGPRESDGQATSANVRVVNQC